MGLGGAGRQGSPMAMEVIIFNNSSFLLSDIVFPPLWAEFMLGEDGKGRGKGKKKKGKEGEERRRGKKQTVTKEGSHRCRSPKK